jgi:hypothetical protein
MVEAMVSVGYVTKKRRCCCDRSHRINSESYRGSARRLTLSGSQTKVVGFQNMGLWRKFRGENKEATGIRIPTCTLLP